MRSPAFCMQCDDGTEMELSQRDLSFEYKGKTLVIPDIKGWHCPACGEYEFIAGDGEAEQHSAEIEAFAVRIDKEEAAKEHRKAERQRSEVRRPPRRRRAG